MVRKSDYLDSREDRNRIDGSGQTHRVREVYLLTKALHGLVRAGEEYDRAWILADREYRNAGLGGDSAGAF
jgi:hypothetical protein